MMRKSRFGSKVGGDARRDEDLSPDGSADEAAEGADRYERSSERRGVGAGASKGANGWGRKKERAGAEQSTSARRVWGSGFSRGGASKASGSEGATSDEVSSARDRAPLGGRAWSRKDVRRAACDERTPANNAPSSESASPPGTAGLTHSEASSARSKGTSPLSEAASPPTEAASEAARSRRLERARTLLEETLEKPRKAKSTSQAPSTPPAFTDPFDDADPFEPFEQCVPESSIESTPEESVYSRSTQTRRKPPSADAKSSKRPQRSLKGRALGYLSRREHSRAELSRKLMPFVPEAESLETLLDELERDGWLSNERFVESVVHRRAGRVGAKVIVNELKRHGVGEELIRETGDKLSQSETARALAVWSSKFGTPPQTSTERAKQARFLAARGFSGGTIAKVLKGGDEDDWLLESPDE